MNKKHKLLHRNNEYITSKLEIIYEEDIQRIVEEKNNLQSKIDKAIEMIEFDKKDRMWDLGEGNIMILQEKRVNELLDILKEDK